MVKHTLLSQEIPQCLTFQANITIISREDCNANDSYNGKIIESMICAGVPGIGGKDACQGDSGGPMVTLVDRDGV